MQLVSSWLGIPHSRPHKIFPFLSSYAPSVTSINLTIFTFPTAWDWNPHGPGIKQRSAPLTAPVPFPPHTYLITSPFSNLWDYYTYLCCIYYMNVNIHWLSDISRFCTYVYITVLIFCLRRINKYFYVPEACITHLPARDRFLICPV